MLGKDRNLTTSQQAPAGLAAELPKHGFSGVTILVIGDLMLDRYVVGNVDRISPEAPVPVVRVTSERAAAGGAGNVAVNLASLGANTIVAGTIGEDGAGQSLLRILERHRIGIAGVVTDNQRPTTSKTRVMSGNHQIVRVDEEHTGDLADAVMQSILQRVRGILETHLHAVIVSDYAKGTLTPPLLRFVIEEGHRRGIPVFIDPKRTDYSIYAQASCLTPNLKEFHAAAAVMGIPHPDIASGGALMRERLDSAMLLVTQGAEGMTLVTRNEAHHMHALAEEVFDVSGAGDTVIATFAAGMAAGLPALPAAQLANIAASIVVRKVGTAPISWPELMSQAGQ